MDFYGDVARHRPVEGQTQAAPAVTPEEAGGGTQK
jgi:hypothetical protein